MIINKILPDEIIKKYLDMLCYNNWKEFEPFTIIVSAHPDDETIGMGSRLKKINNAVFVYITNGAPENTYYYTKAGYRDKASYAKARKKELFNALSLTGFSRKDCIFLDIPDQETAFNIPTISRELAKIFKSHEPDLIITHPYEGGHPDHDSTSLAVHIALQDNLQKNGYAPIALEFTSYYGDNDRIVTNKFLYKDNCPQRDVILSNDEKKEKMEMISCFTTQLEFLKIFSPDVESFRQMPNYDFTEPPHEGKLYYENFEWGVNGGRWREYAKGALEQFGFAEK